MNQELKEKLEKVPAKTFEQFMKEHEEQLAARTPLQKAIDSVIGAYYELGRRIEHVFARKYKLEKEHRQLGYTYWDRPWKKHSVWNSDRTLAWLTLAILVRFQQANKMGHPHFGSDEANENGEEKWDIILGKMVKSFDLIVENEIYDNEIAAEVQEGLKLYAEYFMNLWD